MTDDLLSTLPAPLELRPEQQATAGAMLRRLRESAGVDAVLVASAMKVSLQKLEALEQDRFEELPDITFARGLASSICRAFGVDPTPVLERMPVLAPGLPPAGRRLNEPFRRSSDGPEPLLGSRSGRPWLIAVAVLLLGAALLWLWPTSPIQVGELETPAALEAADEPEGLAVDPIPAPVPEAGETAAPEGPAAQATEAVVPQPAEAAPAVAPEPESRPEPEPVPAETPAAEPPVLSFRGTGETWLTVRDGTGKTLLNRALLADERVSLGGELPLAVTVGRKDAVQVEVRGKPMDILGLGSGSVVRFQVTQE